jgi:hypothetical protein
MGKKGWRALQMMLMAGALLLLAVTLSHTAAQDGTRTCRGNDPGVQFVPADTCPWDDAGQFSAWVSLAHANNYPEDAEFEDGTVLCSYGCCLKLVCPQENAGTSPDDWASLLDDPTGIVNCFLSLAAQTFCAGALMVSPGALMLAGRVRRRTQRKR